MMTPHNGLPPCEQFTVVDWREDEGVFECDVCDRLELSHDKSGHRVLTAAEVEDLRARLIDETKARLSAGER